MYKLLLVAAAGASNAEDEMKNSVATTENATSASSALETMCHFVQGQSFLVKPALKVLVPLLIHKGANALNFKVSTEQAKKKIPKGLTDECLYNFLDDECSAPEVNMGQVWSSAVKHCTSVAATGITDVVAHQALGRNSTVAGILTNTVGQVAKHPPTTRFAQFSVGIHVLNVINKDPGTKLGFQDFPMMTEDMKKEATATLNKLDELMMQTLKDDANYTFQCDGKVYKLFKQVLRGKLVKLLIKEIKKRLNSNDDKDDTETGAGSQLLLEMVENTISQYVGDQADKVLVAGCASVAGQDLRLLL